MGASLLDQVSRYAFSWVRCPQPPLKLYKYAPGAMSLKRRLERLEHQRKSNLDDVPIAIIDGDEVQVAGETMTHAEYDARYGRLIEEAIARGSKQRYFGIDFSLHTDE